MRSVPQIRIRRGGYVRYVRVMNESFLHDVERTLVRGGRLHFWTDVEEYFQTSLELLAATTGLTGPYEVAEQPADHSNEWGLRGTAT